MAETSPERLLIDAARQGDRDALAGLVRRHQDAVYRFGRLMCGSAEDAKDVVQETMITVLEKVDQFRGQSSFRTWLYSIARSQCSRKHRRGWREHSSGEGTSTAHEMVDPAPSAADALAAAGDRAIVRGAIEKLPEMYREVLVLRDIEGLTAPEVSASLSLTVEAVKSRLHRARAQVRAHLAARLGVPGEVSPSPRCPDVVAMLSSHLEQELTGEDCSRMQRHLDSCQACRSVCNQLSELLATCARAGQEPAPPEVRSAVESLLSSFAAE